MTPLNGHDDVPPVAHRQHGVFTRAQALDTGYTRRQIDRRIRSGVWRRVVGRAFAHRDTPIDAWVLASAAWSSRPGCIVVGKVAAALHGIVVELDGTVDVWTDVRGDHGQRGMRARRVRLRDDEVVTLDTSDVGAGRLTTVSRACADTIRWENRRVARNALAWARSRERVTADELRQHVAAEPRTRGNPQLTTFVGFCETGAMSADEDRAHSLLHTFRFTGWRADVPLPDARRPVARADIYFDEERLDVEIDRPETHAHRADADRVRDERLLRLGIATHRIQAADIVADEHRVVDELHAVLDERRRDLGLPPDRRGRSVQPRIRWDS